MFISLQFILQAATPPSPRQVSVAPTELTDWPTTATIVLSYQVGLQANENEYCSPRFYCLRPLSHVFSIFSLWVTCPDWCLLQIKEWIQFMSEKEKIIDFIFFIFFHAGAEKKTIANPRTVLPFSRICGRSKGLATGNANANFNKAVCCESEK